MSSNPFDLTEDDLRRLGIFWPARHLAHLTPTPAVLFMGCEVETRELAGHFYVFTEVGERIFIGEGVTRREAFLQMAQSPGHAMPKDQRKEGPIGELWDDFCRRIMGGTLPTSWVKPPAFIDPMRDGAR